jgi:ankyrin repeat protein
LAQAVRHQRIDDAFRAGDLEALRAAVAPAEVPGGPMPATIGSCLVYAIYHSPFAFIRQLLELGADPNAPADDGFPPLIAALSCARAVPGMVPRTDVDEVIRLLLAFGADPNQRGINDYTALHMAVAERHPLGALRLLEGGADPGLRTRIDECETPLDMARSAGLVELASLIEHRAAPPPRRLRSGLSLLLDVAGGGELLRRQHIYRVRLRLRLHHGDPVRWTAAWGPVDSSRLEENGETLITNVRIDRRSLVAGLFYGIEGMRVGGLRRLEIAPHLGYGDRGVPGIIPPGALLVAEVAVVAAA